jgi:hypothetical protein
MPVDSTAPVAVPASRPFIAPQWHTFSALLIFGFFSFRDALRGNFASNRDARRNYRRISALDFLVIALLRILYGALVAWTKFARQYDHPCLV